MPDQKLYPSELFATEQGNFSISLAPNSDDSKQTDLTITRTDTTTLQEGTHVLTVTLDTPIEKLPVGEFGPLSGTFVMNQTAADPEGDPIRQTVARATPSTLTDSNTELTVSFENRADGSAAPVPGIEYSKASYLHGMEYTEEWRATWLRAIALAWSDDTLKNELLADPYTFFKTHCNYELPPTVDLAVVEDARNGDGYDAGSEHAWLWKLPRSILIMFLPPKPPVEQQAIALAAYEAVGKQYPFTVTS